VTVSVSGPGAVSVQEDVAGLTEAVGTLLMARAGGRIGLRGDPRRQVGMERRECSLDRRRVLTFL
jgi:hypothetical protein